MSPKDRNKLRRLQDKFLALPDVKKFILAHGEDKPILSLYPQATARNLRGLLLPECEGQLRFLLRNDKNTEVYI